ncbi:hypothetical protein PanWU01x14_103540 [Parasponia andersonii]|uniref:Uncharacterized protein n=1 Tax=Parasponia andersonii TaxID=3476 RepID=A0A2P5D262_PARAD|nr:hypothetical protein PanWU01x14_103540 [Parasponia andersonii]
MAACLETTLISVFLAQYALSQITFGVVPIDDHLKPQVVMEFIRVEQKTLRILVSFLLGGQARVIVDRIMTVSHSDYISMESTGDCAIPDCKCWTWGYCQVGIEDEVKP